MFSVRRIVKSLVYRFTVHSTYKYSSELKNKQMTTKEGSASVFLPEGVFYNPVQEFNRDLTIAVVRHYGKLHFQEYISKATKRFNCNKSDLEHSSVYPGLSILEALAATGLRSVRFANEIPLISKVIANDMDPVATKLIEENVHINKVENIVTPTCSNAVMLMMNRIDFSNRFNIIDLDPYGTASPFLDSAVQCILDGGLLCVTCTDMAVLCGSASGTAYGKYGGIAIKMNAQHEQGLRLLLHAIQQAASRHDKVIEPLLSLSIDFYARVFVRVRKSGSGVKKIASRLAIVYSCTGCQSINLQRLGSANHGDGEKVFQAARGPPTDRICAHCGSQFAVAGPLWADELHNAEFLSGLLETMQFIKDDPRTGEMIDYAANFKVPEWMTLAPTLRVSLPSVPLGTLNRIIGMVTVASEELPDVPFYFQTDKLCSIIRAPVPKMADFRSAFLNAGYRVSFSHAAMSSVKTDAPMSFIWDVVCAWKRKFDAELLSAIKKVTRSRSPSPSGDKKIRKDGDGKKKHPPSDAAVRVMEALLLRPINPNVDFSPHALANPISKINGLVRYQPNPLPNWGPKSRARIVKTDKKEDSDMTKI